MNIQVAESHGEIRKTGHKDSPRTFFVKNSKYKYPHFDYDGRYMNGYIFQNSSNSTVKWAFYCVKIILPYG